MLLLTSSGSPADDINPGTTAVVRFSSGSSAGQNGALKQRDVSISSTHFSGNPWRFMGRCSHLDKKIRETA